MADKNKKYVHAFLFEHERYATTNEKQARLTVLRCFDNPVTYSYEAKHNSVVGDFYTPDATSCELVCDNSIGLTDDQCFENNVYKDDYKNLWYGILQIKKQGNIWRQSSSKIRAYFDIQEIHEENGERLHTRFIFKEIEYNIYYTLKGFEDYYELNNKYFIFYDDIDRVGNAGLRQDGEHLNIIERKDVEDVLLELLGELGVDNIYKGIKKFTYSGRVGYIDSEGIKSYKEEQKQDFYIFYSSKEMPSDEQVSLLIKEKLIVDKGGRENAKFFYPNFFKDDIRRIYMVKDNNGFPISYSIVSQFIEGLLDSNKISGNIEIINLMQWRCPLVVENGVSDIISNYSPIEIEELNENDKITNDFIFFLSLSLNYIDGSKDSTRFPNHVDFHDRLKTEGYVEFTYQTVTWRVYK